MMQQTQTYNDGVLNVYAISNTAASGDKPKDTATLKVGGLRYDERTVGMSRYWIAMQAQEKIDLLVRAPRIDSVNSKDIVVPNDGYQYRIKQIQYPKEVLPKSMDLSLERLESHYEVI